MNEDLKYRKAEPADAERIMEIIRQAQAQMRALGSRQWQDGYPSARDIMADLAAGRGRTLRLRERVIAYAAVGFDGEPAYLHIDGQWLTDEPYVLVHRIAVVDGERGRGVAAESLRRGTPARGRRRDETPGRGADVHAAHRGPRPQPGRYERACGHQLRQPVHAAAARPARLPLLRRNPLSERAATRIRETALRLLHRRGTVRNACFFAKNCRYVGFFLYL